MDRIDVGLVLVWIALCLFGIPFGWFVMQDAQKDVDARKISGLNGGRETLAQLLVTTSRLFVFAFVVFLLPGLYVLSPLSRIEGWWRGLVVPFGLDIGLAALTYMMFHKHRTRKGVFQHDLDVEKSRLLAAAAIVSSDMQGNTAAQHELAEALRENTLANRAMTHEMGNGPLAASLANTAALTLNTQSHRVKVDANTGVVQENTQATDDNTQARRAEGKRDE